MSKKLTNTKRKVWVAELVTPSTLGEVRKLTVWQSHTGVECVKWFGSLCKIKPLTKMDKTCGFFPSRVTHKLDRKYTVPATNKEKNEQDVLETLLEQVVPLNINKDARRIIKKLRCEDRQQFRRRLLGALLRNL